MFPTRDIYFHFGHDEEVGGRNGATVSARLFKDQGITFAYILDEGLALNLGSIPGIDRVIASVGMAEEKGWANVRLVQGPFHLLSSKRIL